jgi:hypothetical protein
MGGVIAARVILVTAANKIGHSTQVNHGYPWRCLWRALVQITRITPLRRTILQFSQSFLTDARTFIGYNQIL